jgi:hypothetical protein
MRWAVLGALLLAVTGCYRPAPPGDLGEPVRLVVVANQGRLPRAQGLLVQEIGQALVTRLGWQVSPTGSATLSISIHEEGYNATWRDLNDVPQAQRVRLRGTVLVHSRAGTWVAPCSGEALVTSIGGEPEALREAARICATDITEWLATQAP